MRILTFLLLLIFCFNLQLVADESAIMFSDLGVSAESIAAGGVEGAIQSAASVMENPALMGGRYSFSLDVFHTTLLEEMTYNTLSLSRRMGRVTLGGGYMATELSGIAQTGQDSSGEFYELDQYDYKFEQYYLGLCYRVSDSFSFGVNGKYRSVSIYDLTGVGTSMDIGVKYAKSRFLFTGRLSNIWFSQGYVLYSNGNKESFPVKAVMGVRVSFLRLQPMIQYQFTLDDFNNSRIGLFNAGIKFTPFKNNIISFLGGFRQTNELSATVNRVSMGVNLNLLGFKMSYAYEQIDRDFYNVNNYFSIGLLF